MSTTTDMPKKRKLPLTDEQVLGIHELYKNGMTEVQISKEKGVGTCAVASALARVDPYGRVMQTVYGARKNDPTRIHRFNKVLAFDETPLPEFKPGRNGVLQ